MPKFDRFRSFRAGDLFLVALVGRVGSHLVPLSFFVGLGMSSIKGSSHVEGCVPATPAMGRIPNSRFPEPSVHGKMDLPTINFCLLG